MWFPRGRCGIPMQMPSNRAAATIAGCRSAIAQAEADFQGDLVVADLAIHDMPAGFRHFEPFQIAYGFGRFGQGVVDRLLDTGLRGTDDFDFLVRMVIGHCSSPRWLNRWVM